ncbi:hypothetical protein D4Q52_09955 [Rhodopseudomonas palustris]|uniref:Secreted protein n=1 Tax=Rhodopseudomonas palustris TaxID=1076 RepID=A0A418VHI4_RHOPL|nr:hypothetical protein D4Q52_09955 [Rhodopseudomonas palustris]
MRRLAAFSQRRLLATTLIYAASLTIRSTSGAGEDARSRHPITLIEQTLTENLTSGEAWTISRSATALSCCRDCEGKPLLLGATGSDIHSDLQGRLP